MLRIVRTLGAGPTISVVGFLTHGVNGTGGATFDRWLAAVLVACPGAPLGAYVGSKPHRDQILVFLLRLILLECVSTVVFIQLALRC